MRAVIAAGGTAGHINPALAIAGEIMKREPDSEIVFVGREDGMEKQLVEKAGYRLFPLETHGFQRRLTISNIAFNFYALYCVARAEVLVGRLFRSFKPDVVIGCGGYVSGPVVRKAAHMRIPTAIQEQNAAPGITTKLLSKDVDAIFAASQEASRAIGCPDKTVVTGNPIRMGFFSANREKLRKQWNVGERTCIVSFGGSLGARTINELAACMMSKYGEVKDILHIHATGGYEAQRFSEYAKKCGVDLKSGSIMIRQYIDDMPECFAAADLIISRSGAISISEIEAAGKASVLIPSPNVSENHQYYNAMTLVNAGAALLFEEKDIDFERAADEILALARDKQKLRLMGVNARSRAVTNTTRIIYERIRELIERE